MTVDEIKKQAVDFAKSGKQWHFHILTPECKLNDSKKYALVLENITDNQEYIVYSEVPYMDLGKELVKLLHGDKIMSVNKDYQSANPSKGVIEILHAAKSLSARKIFWHHHMLFPDCKFNNHGDKWVIMFEDMEKDQLIESVYESEPKSDLKHLEKLFYSQNKY